MRPRTVLLVVAALACAAPARAGTVASGPLRATVGEHPWHLAFAQRGGAGLSEAPVAALAFHTPAGWMQATSVASTRRHGKELDATVATSDPAGRRLEVRVLPAGSGAIGLR